jgi:hypothetical protein
MLCPRTLYADVAGQVDAQRPSDCDPHAAANGPACLGPAEGVGKPVMALLVAIEAPRQEDTIPLDMIASKIVEAKPLQLDGDRPRLPRQ